MLKGYKTLMVAFVYFNHPVLTEYVQTAVLTTDKDCDDFNENTLEVFLETSSDEVKAFVAEQIAKLPEKYRATATITIVGIRWV